jgi:hypothetical protein
LESLTRPAERFLFNVYIYTVTFCAHSEKNNLELVYLVDYGVSKYVPLTSLRTLPFEYHHTPDMVREQFNFISKVRLCVSRAELGIRYFLPYSLIAIPLLQCTISLSLLRYFSEFCNTLFAIRYFL